MTNKEQLMYCIAVSPPKSYCCTFVSYFEVFERPASSYCWTSWVIAISVDCKQSPLFPPVIVYRARKHRPHREWDKKSFSSPSHPFSSHPILCAAYASALVTRSQEGKGGIARSLPSQGSWGWCNKEIKIEWLSTCYRADPCLKGHTVSNCTLLSVPRCRVWGVVWIPQSTRTSHALLQRRAFQRLVDFTSWNYKLSFWTKLNCKSFPNANHLEHVSFECNCETHAFVLRILLLAPDAKVAWFVPALSIYWKLKTDTFQS